ncbi:transcription factor HES-1-like [Tubulanus polymorphus]|uniref:transcription factor HES-1-like n=1 Tax=Tubulanus polymorphus TaxID=672921 RepID=UPI003DA4DB90
MHLIHEKYKMEMESDSNLKENRDDSCADGFFQSSSERRKSSKPVMEKKRRARINASLLELKAILLEVMRKEGGRPANRMEKADILEMSVKHLRQIQRQQFTSAVSQDPSVLGKYSAGFNECATEVTRYLGSLEGLDVEIRARLLNHLANTMTNLKKISNPPTNPHVLGQMNRETPANILPNTTMPVNVPMTQGQQGVQLVPTRLPNGDLAFVIPQTMLNNSNQIPNCVLPIFNNGQNNGIATPTPVMGVPAMSMPQTPVMNTMVNQKSSPLEQKPMNMYCSPMPMRYSPVSPVESYSSSKENSPVNSANSLHMTPLNSNSHQINWIKNESSPPSGSNMCNLPETPKSTVTSSDTSPSTKSSASLGSSPSGFTTSPAASSSSGSPDKADTNRVTDPSDPCWRPW